MRSSIERLPDERQIGEIAAGILNLAPAQRQLALHSYDERFAALRATIPARLLEHRLPSLAIHGERVTFSCLPKRK